jgi:hypothetical protein
VVQALLPGTAEAALVAAASWLLTYLLHSLGWLGLAWILDGRIRPGRSPRLRSALWTAAVAGGILTASVQSAAGAGPGLDVGVAESEKLVAELAAPPGDRRPAKDAAAGGEAAGAAPAGPAAGVTWRSPHRAAADPGAWRHAAEHGWPFLVALAGLGGGFVGLLLLTLRWLRLRRRLAGRTRVREGPVREALDDVAGSAGPDAPVVLTRSPAVDVPVALPGREICVPGGLLARLDPETRRAVLAHELAHLERRDPTLMLVLSVLEAVLFVQPLNRLARKRILAASERISDDRVREQGLGPALADGLVTAAGRLRDRLRAPATGLASSPDVGRRVARLLETPGDRGPDRVVGIAAAWAAAVAALGLVAGPSVGIELTDHPAHVDGASGGVPAAVVTTTGPGDEGRVARLRLREAPRPLRLTLRPARRSLRLTLPGGRSVEAPAGADRDGRAPVIRLSDPPAGDYELHVPSWVDRLAVEVDGRLLVGAPGTAGGELPELVAGRGGS